MLTNYFKLAWRNLIKDKGFSAINIFGLALGLATCLLITLFVTDEFSYDKYNNKADRIFRINSDLQINGNGLSGIYTPDPMGPSLVRDYPAIENAVRLSNAGDMLVKKDNETVMEHNSVFADSSLFDVFTLPMLAGDPHTALKEPHSLVISENIARKYFNSTDVLGKTLRIANTTDYKITGVIRDMPVQSHFHFDFIKPISEIESSRSDYWLNNNPATYVLTRPGTTAKDIDQMLAASVKKYVGPQLQQLLHSSLEDLAKNGSRFRYYAMPLLQIHLHSNIKGEFEANSNIQYVYIFIIVAVFILLVACVNFMNLSTARSAGRSKEVGVRKVLGSHRSDLITQFLVESVLTSLFATLLAILFAILLLPYFNLLSGKHIPVVHFFSGLMIPGLLLTAVFVGLLAGSYPAFFLSAFQPIQVLKGKLSSGFKTGWLRNSLVVFQFSTAIVLIIGTLVIYSQLNYIRNKELGYNRSQVLTIDNTYSLWVHAKSFMQDVKSLPGVTGGTMTRYLPNRRNDESDGFFKDAATRANDAIILSRNFIDADYIPTLGMKMVRGRNFSSQMATDSSCVLINETAANLLGYGDPIDKNIYSKQNEKVISYRIIGVVKDFNGSSLREKIEPLVFNLAEERGAMAFRIDGRNIPALIDQIKDRYRSVEKMAGQPFIFSFMDEEFNRLYRSEEKTAKIFITFAVFAIIIACLGLFGLVTYAAEQRTKEIGIRKVLGASVGNVVSLLSRDFLKLVAIAALIAFPVAWWMMNSWLHDFAYRTGIGWWVFVTAGLAALAITLLTVSFRAVKAGLTNPVTSLRSE